MFVCLLCLFVIPAASPEPDSENTLTVKRRVRM